MKFKNHWNAKQFPQKGEVNYEPSQTIPDQSMSVKELLDRHTRGLPIMGAKVPFYNGDEEFTPPDFKNMDLAEIEEFQFQATQELQQINERENARKAEKQKRAAQKQAAIQHKQWLEQHAIKDEKSTKST